MNDGAKMEFDVHFTRATAGRLELRSGDAPAKPEIPLGSIPRVTKLMALSLRCEELILSGEVADYAKLARLGHLTRARMTQIMNLLNLAPDIQEEILFLPRTTHGCDSISERDVRPICAIAYWKRQRQLWQQLQDRIQKQQAQDK
jgi:hypothetical protein